MKQYRMYVVLIAQVILLSAINTKSAQHRSSTNTDHLFTSADPKTYILQLVNEKIKHHFSHKMLSFTNFESVKNYIKTDPTWKERPNGRLGIHYRCKYKGCTTSSSCNVEDAASCFLNHYGDDFFSCDGCGKKYRLIKTLFNHGKNCTALLDSNESDFSYDSDDSEISDAQQSPIESLQSSGSEDTFDSVYEKTSQDSEIDDINMFDLGILCDEETMEIDPLACHEILEPEGVNPRLIFTHAYRNNVSSTSDI